MSLKEFIEFVADKVKHVGLREGLIYQADANLAFAWETTARWLAADDDAKADIEMLFEPMVGSEQTAIERLEELSSGIEPPVKLTEPFELTEEQAKLILGHAVDAVLNVGDDVKVITIDGVQVVIHRGPC